MQLFSVDGMHARKLPDMSRDRRLNIDTNKLSLMLRRTTIAKNHIAHVPTFG